MGLSALLVRVATVYALRGATLAGDRVIDAPMDPASEADHANAPVIAVYSGSEDGQVEGRDLIGADLEIDLTVQAFIPDGVKVTVGGQVLELDVRGSAGELALNVLERQVVRRLMASDDPWPALWRELVLEIRRSLSQSFLLRKGSEDAAIRCAAREMTFTLAPLSDPPLGGPLPPIWLEALDLMRTAPELAPIVAWLELEAAAPDGLPDWRKAQAELGLTLRGVQALGIAPADLPTDGIPAVELAGMRVGATPDAIELEVDAATVEEHPE